MYKTHGLYMTAAQFGLDVVNKALPGRAELTQVWLIFEAPNYFRSDFAPEHAIFSPKCEKTRREKIR